MVQGAVQKPQMAWGGHGVEAAVVAPDIVAVDDEDRNACQEQDHK